MNNGHEFRVQLKRPHPHQEAFLRSRSYLINHIKAKGAIELLILGEAGAKRYAWTSPMPNGQFWNRCSDRSGGPTDGVGHGEPLARC